MKKKTNINKQFVLFLLFVFLIFLLDQLSKYFIVKWLHSGQTLTILNNYFNVTFIKNSGTVFGLLQQYSILLTVLALTTLVIILVFYIVYAKKNFLLATACILITGGALGNLSDRIRFGYVIDFLDFHYSKWHWPAFNCADAAITMGIILILFSLSNTKVIK